MKNHIKMLLKVFLPIVLVILFITTYNVFAKPNIIEAMKEHFKTGVLKDFTPKMVSSDSVMIRPEGPFLMVVGIERDTYMLDERLKDQKEKIKFELVEGAGKFASVNDSQDKNSGTFLIVPDHDGTAAVLFYPNVGLFSSKKSQIKVSVVNQDVKNITGVLTYTFQGTPVDKGLFEKVDSGYKSLATGPLMAERIIKNHSKRLFHDKFGLKQDRVEEDDSVTKFHNDGSVELINNKGESKVTPSRGYHSLPLENAWGVDQDHVIYLSISPRISKVISGSCSFMFFNKNSFYYESNVVIGDEIIDYHSRLYSTEKGIFFWNSDKFFETSLNGIKLQEWDDLHELK